ncbi:MAG TPA: class I SAM-dependent methyltransferase [Chitinophagales bacterium]|nr:class I SAM-dependent methyltransferase [Chitinophagales bacterium]
MDVQKKIFLEVEADSWFERNIQVLENYSLPKDPVADTLLRYIPTDAADIKILEIGCSSGHRLQAIKNRIPNAHVYGIEPSKKAVEYCTLHHPDVIITQGTAEDMARYEDNSFDVVVIGFVFYVVDRQLLFKVAAEIDRLLKPQGHLIIIDFYGIKPHKNVYHHVKEPAMFSYKQDYSQLFTASHLYHLIGKSSHNHATLATDGSSDFYNKLSVSILLKDHDAAY